MYIECAKCGSPKLKFTGLEDYIFYCENCFSFLKQFNVKEFQTLASQTSSNSYKSLLVKWSNPY